MLGVLFAADADGAVVAVADVADVAAVVVFAADAAATVFALFFFIEVSPCLAASSV